MLSVVIATKNCERALVRTLAMLVAGAAAGFVREVILADGGSTDATVEVGDIAGCEILASPSPVGERLKAAVAKARAPWLMFLRPGVVLDPAWVEETTRFLDRCETLGALRAGVFRRLPSGGSRPLWIEALALLRESLGGRPRPEQGLVISRHFYEKIGGHDAHAADPEADLIARLGRRRIVTLSCGSLQTAD